jgi:hypothetical protein
VIDPAASFDHEQDHDQEQEKEVLSIAFRPAADIK